MVKGQVSCSVLCAVPGVTTVTQEAQLQTKLYLEFGGITRDGNVATPYRYF